MKRYIASKSSAEIGWPINERGGKRVFHGLLYGEHSQPFCTYDNICLQGMNERRKVVCQKSLPFNNKQKKNKKKKNLSSDKVCTVCV